MRLPSLALITTVYRNVQAHPCCSDVASSMIAFGGALQKVLADLKVLVLVLHLGLAATEVPIRLVLE